MVQLLSMWSKGDLYPAPPLPEAFSSHSTGVVLLSGAELGSPAHILPTITGASYLHQNQNETLGGQELAPR